MSAIAHVASAPVPDGCIAATLTRDARFPEAFQPPLVAFGQVVAGGRRHPLLQAIAAGSSVRMSLPQLVGVGHADGIAPVRPLRIRRTEISRAGVPYPPELGRAPTVGPSKWVKRRFEELPSGVGRIRAFEVGRTLCSCSPPSVGTMRSRSVSSRHHELKQCTHLNTY
jgi:hypothetical protein